MAEYKLIVECHFQTEPYWINESDPEGHRSSFTYKTSLTGSAGAPSSQTLDASSGNISALCLKTRTEHRLQQKNHFEMISYVKYLLYCISDSTVTFAVDNLGSDLSAIKVELVPKKKNSNGGGLTPIVAERSLDQMLDEHINRNQVNH